jgi:4-hydroxythreonine-4-phosphate dehydrogenase
MKFEPIIIVAGEPNSIFSEIFLKTLKNNRFKSPIILICSKTILIQQISFLKSNLKFSILNQADLLNKKIKLSRVNLIDVDYSQTKPFEKISSKSNDYINKSFKIAINLIKNKISKKLINGPISKKYFLKNKFNGITEYLAYHTNTKKFIMIIYNKSLSVCPITTHIPIKYINKFIKKSEIIDKVKIVNNFWKKKFKFKPNIAVTGLNPHCESIDAYNEDTRIIKPAIKKLKKLKYNVSGPFSADTIFLKNNRNKFDIVIGMYHDQVLTPIKTLYEYDAINITAGLPFLRVSPDHGPNENMMGKNTSNPLSLIKAIEFLDKN